MTGTHLRPRTHQLGLAWLAVLALAGTALAACGGDDDDRPTKAEFVERAGAICRESDQKLTPIGEAIFAEAEGEPTPEQAQRFFAESAPVLNEDIGRFRALEAPEGDEAEITAIDQAAAEGLSAFERLAGDPDAALSQLEEGEPDPFARFNQLVADYGIEGCASEE